MKEDCTGCPGSPRAISPCGTYVGVDLYTVTDTIFSKIKPKQDIKQCKLNDVHEFQLS